MEPIVFKHWSNKGYAAFSTLHKVIRIATLSLAYNLLQIQPVLAQSDTLSPKMFFDLEEVEMIGEQESTLYSPLLRQLQLIQLDQLTAVSSRSVAALLDYYPGIDIRTRGVHGIQSDVSIQGGSFDQSLILINGIDMSDPQTGHFSLDLPIQISQMHQVEILKGPASKKYGLNAYAGAVNMITRPSDSLSLKAEASYGQFNTRNAATTLHLPVGNSKNIVAASYAGSDGYRANTDYQHAGLFLHSAMENDLLKSDLMVGWNRKAFGANAFYTPRFPEQYEETGSWMTALKVETRKPSFRIFGEAYWRRHLDHFLLFRNDPKVYENYHRTDVTGLASGMKVSSPLGFSTFKVSARNERIHSNNLGDPTDHPVKIRGGEGLLYSKFKSRSQLSLSADHHVQMNRFYLSTGLLLHTMIADRTVPGIYPGIDLSYLLHDKLSLFASFNRSMRLPTYTDLYYEGPQNRGNPHLLPEKALTLETGLKYDAKWLRADLALFYRKGVETIDWIWTDSLWQTSNITELDTYGGETSLYLLPSALARGFNAINHLRISYSYAELSKSSDTHISNYALDNLRHKFIFDLAIQLPLKIYVDGKVTWQERNGSYLHYTSPQATPYETPYDPFWLIDLQAGIKLNRITLFMDLTNLLNTTYREIGSVVMPGRWFIAGIKFR
ncbi:MAG: TonB-dependent receptor [Bacteroidales bacterium]